MSDALVPKRWQTVVTVVAIVASGYAGIRGEMAASDAGNAEEAVGIAEKASDAEATAILNLLLDRMDDIEQSEQELRIYVVSMDQRDKYLEKMLWEVYRSHHGTRAANRVVADAPEKPEPPPLVSRPPRPRPKSAADAKAQYQRACEAGDPLCASPLE